MSVKLTLSPRYALALARAAARAGSPLTADEQDALDRALRRLAHRMELHRVEEIPQWGTNAQGRPR